MSHKPQMPSQRVSRASGVAYPWKDLKIVVSERILLSPFEESQVCEAIYRIKDEPVDDWHIRCLEALQNRRLSEGPTNEQN